jgi:hypothetical protein
MLPIKAHILRGNAFPIPFYLKYLRLFRMEGVLSNVPIICLSALFGAFFEKHHHMIENHHLYLSRGAHIRSVAVFHLSMLFLALGVPVLAILTFVVEKDATYNFKDIWTIIHFSIYASVLFFKIFPSINPFLSCSCMAETTEFRPRLDMVEAPQNVIASKTVRSDKPVPEHRGDKTCVVCYASTSVNASIYECGHNMTCRKCLPGFIAHGWERCPRCKARRCY